MKSVPPRPKTADKVVRRKSVPGKQRAFLSFVVPVYGSPGSLELLRDRVRAVCQVMQTHYELILVDDRCPRGSWNIIRELAANDRSIVGVRLSRNFGQHAAIHAGLSRAKGEWIVVMDCDLQDRPEDVPAMLERALEGFNTVRARRSVRRDKWHRRVASKVFYAVLSYLTDTSQSAEIANFGIYHRKVINAINQWHEDTKYFPAIVQWVGFEQSDVPVQHGQRLEGPSSYTLGSLVRLSTNVIIGFSDKPLRLITVGGLGLAFISFFIAIIVAVSHLLGAITVTGWTSMVLSLWFLGGCILFALGLMGIYVGRVLVEAKGRPTFVVDETIVHGAEMEASVLPTGTLPQDSMTQKSY